MKFIHLSDLHIHKDDKKNQAVAQMLQRIQSQYPQHYLIVTGDITDDGDQKQYENAAALLSPFAGRIYTTCGNHDYGNLGNFYEKARELRYSAFEQQMNLPNRVNQLYSVVLENKAKLIALDSNLRTNHVLDFACGKIEEEQLNQLHQELTATSLPKIVALHHHPFIHLDPTMKLLDAEKFLECCSGKTDALLFGHRHKQDVWANRFGINWLTASGSSPEESAAFEIIVENGRVTMGNLAIE